MVVDLFMLYQFLRRLSTPFEEWRAFELGIIDENGNILKNSKERRSKEEQDAFGKFDLLVLKLKQLLEKIPGGKSRLGSYAAALWLIKEGRIDENTASLLEEYMQIAETTMSAGSGAVAGIGVGDDGEPGGHTGAKKNMILLKRKKQKQRE